LRGDVGAAERRKRPAQGLKERNFS
jgi:hypothetical protein